MRGLDTSVDVRPTPRYARNDFGDYAPGATTTRFLPVRLPS